MPKTLLFKENIHTFGQKDINETINFEFELNDGVTEDQIEWLKPDCGICTTVRLSEDKKKVVGQTVLAKAWDYVDRATPITKYVLIYLNDGEPEWIIDPETKTRKINDKKGIERLNISGIVTK